MVTIAQIKLCRASRGVRRLKLTLWLQSSYPP